MPKTYLGTNALDDPDLAASQVTSGTFDDARIPSTITRDTEMDAKVSDTAYDATTWNGDTTHAPSKNAVRDKIETMGGGSVSDTVYGAGWNGDTTVAPSKNAVYDEMELRAPKASPTFTGSVTAPMRGCRVYRSAALSLANGGQTPIAFDAESFDSDALHDNSTNPDRVILNKVGRWLVTWQASYSGNATGFRNADLYLNGAIHQGRSIPSWSGGACMVGGTDIVNATAITDYVTLSPYQDSGGSLAFSLGSAYTFLAVTYLGT